jgi:hypothetical protein
MIWMRSYLPAYADARLSPVAADPSGAPPPTFPRRGEVGVADS